MTGPKHLWSGDWERDSEESARARGDAERIAALPQPEAPQAPERRLFTETREAPVDERPAPSVARPAPIRPRPSAAPPRPQRQPRRRVARGMRRVALIVLALVVVVTGAAFGLGQLVGPHRSVDNSGNGQPAWLGVEMGNLPTGAVVLTGVANGGPAARAGLHTGDVVTEVEGRPVAAPVDVTEAVGAMRPGDTIEVQVLRGSQTIVARPKLSAQAASAP